ncbi:DUF5134 domain-containing protein [Streptomyces sp. DW26H14]|uniref:DUF5134 domain-containing protein n=1 Tax=Streptomyces sp. DW26H14 TaxID=3435395 RepID=UPI00403D5E7C
MIAAVGLKWLLTVLFSAVAGYALWRALPARPTGTAAAGQSALDRTAHALHAVMAVAMGVMVWPWGMRLPAVPQVVFFSLAAVWFLVAALFARTSGDSVPRRLGHAVPHALAMAAMAWMLAAMDGGPAQASGGGAAQMADMPGMDMPAPGSTATMTLRGGGAQTAVVLAVAFLALALWWLAKGFDLARSGPRLAAVGEGPVPAGEGPATSGGGAPGRGLGAYDLSCHGVMALGMSVMLAVLA